MGDNQSGQGGGVGHDPAVSSLQRPYHKTIHIIQKTWFIITVAVLTFRRMAAYINHQQQMEIMLLPVIITIVTVVIIYIK